MAPPHPRRPPVKPPPPPPFPPEFCLRDGQPLTSSPLPSPRPRPRRPPPPPFRPNPFYSIARPKRRHPPPTVVDASDSRRAQEDQPAPQQTATPNPGPFPEQYTKEDEQMDTPIHGSSQAQYSKEDQPAPTLEMAQRRAQEDQPAPQRTATPNPGPSPEQDEQTATTIPGSSQAQYSQEDQPAPALEMAQRRKELFDSSKMEELSITDASSPSLTQSPSHELIGTTKLEESSSSLPRPESHNELIDSTKLEESSSSLPQPESDKELVDTTKLEESSSSLSQPESCVVSDPLAVKLDKALSSSSCVSPLLPTGLFIKYFVRLDKDHLFHTYPDRGGPFQNLDEAQKAVNLHHAAQQKNLCSYGLSDEEMTVRNALYWFHDGTRKHSAEALDSSKTYRPTRELLNSLLDRYNEDNNLLGDKAYVLKKIVSHKSCFDGKGCIYRAYSHFNITMETKGADDNNDLYFAEVTTTRGDYELYVLTCLCVLKPGDNGQCHVCEDAIKHPTDDVYIHGRSRKSRRSHCSDAFGAQLFEQLYAVHDEAWLKAEETRVRQLVKEETRVRQLVKEEREARLRRMVKTPPLSPECHSSPRPLAAVMTPPPPQGRRPSPQRLDAPTSQAPPAPPVVPWRQVPDTIPPPPQGRLPSQQCLDARSTQRGPDYHARAARFTTWRSSSGYVPPPRRGRLPTAPGGRASMDMDRW